jgi:hypothetical protein
MNVPRRAQDRTTRSTSNKYRGDLKFVPIGVGEHAAGGWYRMLPDGEIEVMSRGQLERVPLGNSDPEKKAKSVVRSILRRHH